VLPSNPKKWKNCWTASKVLIPACELISNSLIFNYYKLFEIDLAEVLDLSTREFGNTFGMVVVGRQHLISRAGNYNHSVKTEWKKT